MSVKISQLGSATIPLSGGEILAGNQGGVTITMSLSDIKTYTNSDVSPLSANYAVKNANNNFTTGQKITGSLSANQISLSSGAYLKSNGTNIAATFDNTSSSGNYNVFIGDSAGYSNSADRVNAFGYNSATSNTGNDLNALGSSAGWDNTGDDVNALGVDAAHGNSGSDLNALGYFAGYDNAGNYVNSIGSYAGWTNIGSDCNFVGSDSGYNNSGNNVNALGVTSGYNNAGNYNIFIGSNTATSPTSLSGCIVLGSYATATANNQMALGSTTVPLLTSGSGAASGLYLNVNINGTNFKLPLYI